MDQIKKYLSVLLIVLFAVIVTGLAIYAKGSESSNLLAKDSWGIPLWLTPVGYLGLALLIKGGPNEMNKPVYALIAFFVYALAAVALFVPLPPQFQWHFIIGLPTIIYIFFG
jgi:hypothetical protein